MLTGHSFMGCIIAGSLALFGLGFPLAGNAIRDFIADNPWVPTVRIILVMSGTLIVVGAIVANLVKRKKHDTGPCGIDSDRIALRYLLAAQFLIPFSCFMLAANTYCDFFLFQSSAALLILIVGIIVAVRSRKYRYIFYLLIIFILVAGLAPHTSAGVLGRIVGFTKALGCYAHPYFHSAKRRNCDSDEDAIMLLLDALINFSKTYLPNTRGGSMDAPLVLSSRIDPEEIDDESHNLDIFDRFPVEFYEKTFSPLKPADVLEYIDNVEMHLGTPQQYEGLMFSHHTSSIHAGPTVCLYKRLPSMREKVEAQISLAETIRAVDQRGVVEKVLSSHFLPDIMGNSRAFSKQKVRCTNCGAKYRRMPLTGKCKCGGNLILSVSKGSVTKYLDISQELVNRYPVSHYLKQRLEIQEFGINSLFESDKSKQSSLDVFF